MSDYTRYLPKETSGRKLFWTIYGGNVVATICACSVKDVLITLVQHVLAAEPTDGHRASGDPDAVGQPGAVG